MTTFKGPGCYGPFGPIQVFLIVLGFSQHPGDRTDCKSKSIIKSVIYRISRQFCQACSMSLNQLSSAQHCYCSTSLLHCT